MVDAPPVTSAEAVADNPWHVQPMLLTPIHRLGTEAENPDYRTVTSSDKAGPADAPRQSAPDEIGSAAPGAPSVLPGTDADVDVAPVGKPPEKATRTADAERPTEFSADNGSGPADGLYAGFFGLKERPFTLLPDPSFLFWSAQHARAFAVLEFGLLSRAPITLITGEIGSGKTTLLQKLLKRMDDDLTIGLISNAQGGRGELLQWVLNALNIDCPISDGYVQQFRALQDFLIAEYAQGRRVVVIVDEAQNLSVEGLEEIRMLTNINSNKDELILLILVGQPELRDIVRQPQMRQLAQRVTASFHLTPMDAETTAAYIAHRLKVAGGSGQEIEAEALSLIHRHTGGVPRPVNQLCELAMIYAWADGTRQVTVDTIRKVLDDGVFFGDVDAFAAGTEDRS